MAIATVDPERVRNNARHNFGKVLGVDYDKLARKIEVHVFNWALQCCDDKHLSHAWHTDFDHMYKSKIRSLHYNLKNSGDLREAVTNATIKPDRLVRMTHEELQPEIWKAVQAEVERLQNEKFAPVLDATLIGSGAFVCRKCKSDRTTYTELQTRSADEPMTQHVVCYNCGTRWKM